MNKHIIGEKDSHRAHDHEHTDTNHATENGNQPVPAKEIGGRDGLDPTRYGDWEKNGRCIDF